MNLNQLKAQAYDIIAKMEKQQLEFKQTQEELRKVNKQIVDYKPE